MSIRSGGGTFVRFQPLPTIHFEARKKKETPPTTETPQAEPPKVIKLPAKVEKKLKEIADKFGADVNRAKQMYVGLKALKNLKLTDEMIFQTISHDLDPNSPIASTAAMGEEGGFIKAPPQQEAPKTEQPKEAKLPPKVEKKLKEIADRFGADVKVARQMYTSLKNMTNLKLTDEMIFQTITHDLDPNSPKMSTMALHEEGGFRPTPPPAAPPKTEAPKTEKPQEAKLPPKIEKKLKEIADQFGADIKVARRMYNNLKNLTSLKLTDEQILQTIKHDLDPNSPKMSTMALYEEGGFIPTPPPAAPPKTEAPKTEKPKEIKLPKKVEKKLTEIANKFGADVNKTKEMYVRFKNMKNLNLTDEAIFQLISTSLDPNSPKMSTMALHEEGGFRP